jgi:hypothetical protein
MRIELVEAQRAHWNLDLARGCRADYQITTKRP